MRRAESAAVALDAAQVAGAGLWGFLPSARPQATQHCALHM